MDVEYHCDDEQGIRRVPETRAEGTAVEGREGAWIAFKNVDFGQGAGHLVVTASNAGAL